MVARLLLCVALLGCGLFCSSCGSRRTAAMLNDIETYIQERPDSALAEIRVIDSTTLSSRRLRAQYALLQAMALDKNWIDTTDVNVVMPAVTYYDRHPSGDRQAKAWYYLGRIQENGGKLTEASVSLLKAERYSESSDNVAFKALVFQTISSIYSKTHFHDEALRYSELSYSASLAINDTLGANNSLYRKAQDLYNLGRYAESDSLYRILINEKKVHPNLRASLLCSYALLCVTYKEDYLQAIQYFEEVIDSYGSLRNANFWGAYAYSLMRVGKTQQAESLFKQLQAQDTDRTLTYKSWKSLSDAYLKDYESAYHLQKAASDIQEKNVSRVLRQSTIKAQKDFLEQMNLESQKESKRRQAIAWSICLLLLLLALLVLLYFRRRSDRIAQEKESLLETCRILMIQQTALNTQNSSLSAQVRQIEDEKAAVRNQYIQMCQSYFSHIGRVNEILSVHASDIDNSLYQELKKSIQQIGTDISRQEAFERMLNDAFDNVMVHFRADYPNKKPRYYQLVSFLFAGFDATTISAIIPGYQKHNVYVERHRLKEMLIKTNSPYRESYLQFLF